MLETNVQSATGHGLSDSVRKTLSNTFATVGAMLALTAVASYFAVGVQLSFVMSLLIFAVSIGLLFAIHAFRNSGVGLVLLAAFSVLMGVTLAPMITQHLALPNGAMLVANAAGLTAVATFACSIYAINSKRDFSRLGAFLFAGTIVLLVAMIVAMFVQVPALHLTLSAVGVLLFTGWLLHDMSKIVTGQETNYISASIGVYLDIVNMFTHLLRLLGLLPKSD